MDNKENDLRGYDLRADNFKNQLLVLINNSNLNISTVYYIVKDMCNILENGYNNAASQQYQEFCDATKKEEAEASNLKGGSDNEQS